MTFPSAFLAWALFGETVPRFNGGSRFPPPAFSGTFLGACARALAAPRDELLVCSERVVADACAPSPLEATASPDGDTLPEPSDPPQPLSGRPRLPSVSCADVDAEAEVSADAETSDNDNSVSDISSSIKETTQKESIPTASTSPALQQPSISNLPTSKNATVSLWASSAEELSTVTKSTAAAATVKEPLPQQRQQQLENEEHKIQNRSQQNLEALQSQSQSRPRSQSPSPQQQPKMVVQLQGLLPAEQNPIVPTTRRRPRKRPPRSCRLVVDGEEDEQQQCAARNNNNTSANNNNTNTSDSVQSTHAGLEHETAGKPADAEESVEDQQLHHAGGVGGAAGGHNQPPVGGHHQHGQPLFVDGAEVSPKRNKCKFD